MKIKDQRDVHWLVADYLAGDKNAFTEIYYRYKMSIISNLSKMLPSVEDAKDVLQDVMLKLSIYIEAKRFDVTKATFSTIVINVARNSAIDFLRIKDAKKRRITNSIYGSSMEIPDDRTATLNDVLIDFDTITMSLPKQHRKILRLTVLQQMTNAEIAEELKIPLGTVKTSIRLARMNIKQQLIKEPT
ncbi:MAG: sigma-70 family RNA polymerase sigma factor [Candidatus Paceibacterota bacterium]